MSPSRQSHGQQAENQAKRFLLDKGYSFITANYRCSYGEIDLVFLDGNQIVFVEVKSRDDDSFEFPAEAVTVEKLRKISTTADHFFQSHENLPQSGRIDVIAITQAPFSLDHMQNVTME